MLKIMWLGLFKKFQPPIVKCETRLWHPNISEEGEICLSLLRQNSIDGLGWAPTRTLKDVVWGLSSLFMVRDSKFTLLTVNVVSVSLVLSDCICGPSTTMCYQIIAAYSSKMYHKSYAKPGYHSWT